MHTFQYISNIYLEKLQNVDFCKLVPSNAEYLFLLGNIGRPNEDITFRFLKYCSANFKKVFYIAGTYEFYIATSNFYDVNSQILQLCSKFSNVIFLQNMSYKLPDDTLILGTTLWSDISDIDYKFLKHKNELITPSFINKLHGQATKWLEKKIKSNPNKQIIILSHFSSNLIDHAPNIKYWICGA